MPYSGPVPAPVSRETLQRLDIYADLVRKWNPTINLVAKSTIPQLSSRHMDDSAQLMRFVLPGARVWADLGSGGGFPGAVVAVLAAETIPEMKVVCVESDERKVTFLRTVSRETGVAFQVIAGRIETIPPLEADIVSARALAPLPALLGHVARHLASDGTALLMKGARSEEELSEARKLWRFDIERFTSETDRDAAILKVGAVQSV